MKLADIPVFILAGGFGTRLSEETTMKPKPMVEIGGIPILVHLMRYYYSFGFRDFVICAGYKSKDIKQYFLNYEYNNSHLIIDSTGERLEARIMEQKSESEDWRVFVLDTGSHAMTGARVARALDLVDDTLDLSNFALTYGDGLSNLSLSEEYEFHVKHKKIGTILGVHPVARFGELSVGDGNQVVEFKEKPQANQGLINGGFFFFNREFQNYLSTDDSCVLEEEPLSKLAEDGELVMYPHEGFWHPMDTLRDKKYLEKLWTTGDAAWRR